MTEVFSQALPVLPLRLGVWVKLRLHAWCECCLQGWTSRRVLHRLSGLHTCGGPACFNASELLSLLARLTFIKAKQERGERGFNGTHISSFFCIPVRCCGLSAAVYGKTEICPPVLCVVLTLQQYLPISMQLLTGG